MTHHCERLESSLYFPILSCSAFNSVFVANIAIFLSKSELFITPEMSDLLTKSFSLSLNQVSHL